MYWSINPEGYENASVWNFGTNHTVLIHRLQAIAEWGPDAVVGKHVHHKNGCSFDNRIANLELLDPAEHGRLHNPGYSDDECIEALISVSADLGHSPGMLEYKEYDGVPSVGYLCNTFGSWDSAKRAAGLETFGVGRKKTEADCVRSLRRASGILGDPFTIKEYDSLNFSPCGDTMANKFGSWNAAKDAAGLTAINVRD